MHSRSSTTAVLIALLIVFSFPLWIGIAGGLFGIIVGMFGAIFGIIAGIFGAVFGTIGGLFDLLFGWDWPFDGYFRWNFFSIVIIALIIALLARSKHTGTK